VYVYLHDSCCTIGVRLHPDTHIGPDRLPQPADASSPKALLASVEAGTGRCRSADMAVASDAVAILATTGGSSLETTAATWKPSWTLSLKGIIEESTGFEVGRQRLLLHSGVHMSRDDWTVRSYGLRTGDTVHVHSQSVLASPCDRGGVVLACSAKRFERDERHRQREVLRTSLCETKQGSMLLRRSESDGVGICVMPKWISQENPKLFSKAGHQREGLSASATSLTYFGDFHVWHPDEDGHRWGRDLRNRRGHVYVPAYEAEKCEWVLTTSSPGATGRSESLGATPLGPLGARLA